MLVRLARGFRAAGHEVSVIIFPGFDEGIASELQLYATCVRVDSAWWLTYELFGRAFDVVHCFTGDAFLYLCVNYKYIRFSRCVVGVYHPRQFLYDYAWGRGLMATWWRSRFAAAAPQLHFMNESVLSAHAHYWGGVPCPSFVLPIPVDVCGDQAVRSPVPYKIVSIGRLVLFKNYHETVFDALERYPQLTYDIYGDGPCEHQLRDAVAKRGLSSRVSFKGLLRYAEMKAVLAEAWVFIGMGTALVEACAAGVPSLIAVESLGLTYGWFHDFTDGHVGELVPGRAAGQAFEYLSALMDADVSRYDAYSCQARARADFFSTEHFVRAYAERLRGTEPSESDWQANAALPLLYALETRILTPWLAESQKHK